MVFHLPFHHLSSPSLWRPCAAAPSGIWFSCLAQLCPGAGPCQRPGLLVGTKMLCWWLLADCAEPGRHQQRGEVEVVMWVSGDCSFKGCNSWEHFSRGWTTSSSISDAFELWPRASFACFYFLAEVFEVVWDAFLQCERWLTGFSKPSSLGKPIWTGCWRSLVSLL